MVAMNKQLIHSYMVYKLQQVPSKVSIIKIWDEVDGEFNVTFRHDVQFMTCCVIRKDVEEYLRLHGIVQP